MSTDKNPDKDNLPKQISPELLQMLAAMQAKAQQGQGLASQHPQMPKATKRQEMIMKAAKYIGIKLQNGVHNVDRFINLVVKQTDPDRNDVIQTARAPILFGTYVIIIFFVFGGLWAGLAPLDSASHAMGTVISDSKIQRLQFLEGGNIKAIYVKPGDKVKTGDPLVAIDETRYRTDYDNFLNQYRTHMAMEARLIAERDGASNITFPEELIKDAKDPEVVRIIHTQENLLQSQRSIVNANIDQLTKKLEATESAKVAAIKGHSALAERARAAKDLLAKGFMSRAGLHEVEIKEIQYKSEVARCESEIANTKIELINIKNKVLTDTLKELERVQVQLADTREKFNGVKDRLDHAVLTSPVDGVVNALNVNTIGGVVHGGHPVVEVSPTNDILVVEARIAPQDISSVRVGLVAKIQFTSFKSRTSPLFTGKVASLSPDIIIDQNPNAGAAGQGSYYLARIEIDMKEFNYEAKLRNLELHPGMPVNINIVTGTRTLLRYLLDPVTDSMFKAFKEK